MTKTSSTPFSGVTTVKFHGMQLKKVFVLDESNKKKPTISGVEYYVNGEEVDCWSFRNGSLNIKWKE